MIKQEITFEDFEGNQKSKTFHFHLSKAELIELEASTAGGIEATIKRIQDAEDVETLIGLFKKIILMSIGQRSDDGDSFMKSDDIRNAFAGHPAYSELFLQLATDADFASNFIQGLLPMDLVRQVKEQVEQDKPLAPPAPPAGDA